MKGWLGVCIFASTVVEREDVDAVDFFAMSGIA
jgi:hypothetical protein